jgi:hypothetical protein
MPRGKSIRFMDDYDGRTDNYSLGADDLSLPKGTFHRHQPT